MGAFAPGKQGSSRAGTATSRDVARVANVSLATVSLVLNGRAQHHRLSEATEARVRSAAASLGYAPNHAARSLRRQRTNTLTFMTTDLGNRYFAEVATAADEAARERGYVVNIVAARGVDAEAAAIERLHAGASDGLVVHGGSDRVTAALAGIVRRGMACVVLQDPGAAGTTPCVRVDIAQGGLLATRHLLALGHRRIAHITDQRMLGQIVNERLQGYHQALEEAGIPFDPTCVIAGENSFAGGDAAMRALLARPGAHPSAVFVFNDQMAIGGLHAIAALGMRVPQDMAVVGFDGTDLGAVSIPELTTIDHPRRELGRLATMALVDQLEGKDVPAMQVLPVRLLVRRSCGFAG